jgi:replicative superfamily II helicase
LLLLLVQIKALEIKAPNIDPKIRAVNELVKNEKYESMDAIKSITGVGDVRAEKWYNLGLRTVDQVREAIASGKITSTHHIDMGLKYYEDLIHYYENIEKKELYKKILEKIKNEPSSNDSE